MLIVKITALLIVITVILKFLIEVHLTDNIKKSLAIRFGIETPWYVTLLGLLVAFDIIGILASAIWFLFIR